MLTLLSVFTFSTINSNAQFTINTTINTPVCAELGKQGDPRIIETANGGAYIAWKDWRNGTANPDIFLQRINKKGEILWVINGLNICTDLKDQSTPNLIEDNQGGCIVAWSDWRSGIERDLYAQKVDSNGVIQWPLNGVVITNKTNREHNEKIITDGAGGCIVFWEQQFGGLWDIWGQHLNASGQPLWTAGGIPMANIAGNKINPKVQTDKNGGAIVTWQDERSGNYDVYAQRVSAAGDLLWGNTGIAIAIAPNVQTTPKIDPDPITKGVYICWIDKRNGIDYDIYAQRVDSNGTALWAANGIPVCNATQDQSAQDILSNAKTNGLIVVWKDKRNALDLDIYAQRISPQGNIMWGANGVTLASGAKDQLNPNICPDDYGGAIVVYVDENATTTNDDIKAQRIDSSGILQWQSTGVIISNAVGKQSGPKNCVDGDHGSIIVWEDDRIVGNRDIYMHHINFMGSHWPLAVNNKKNNNNNKPYPNPTNGQFAINGIMPNDNIKIYNSLGQNISFTSNFINGTLFIKLSDNTPNGLYKITVWGAKEITNANILKQ